MHLVPAAAVRLMKRRVLSRPGVRPLIAALDPTLAVSGFTLPKIDIIGNEVTIPKSR
jgi:hypothetical protein